MNPADPRPPASVSFTNGRLSPEPAIRSGRSQFSFRPRRNREGELFAGRYRLVKRIGMGGTGTVYLAVVQGSAQSVAVKVFDCVENTSADAIDRSLTVARAASELGHPNIIRVLYHGHTPDGLRYLVTEYLEGEDLATCISAESPLPWRRAQAIALQILYALDSAHRHAVRHGGLRPEQCFLTRNADGTETVKLLDFGARLAVRRSTDPYAERDDPSAGAPRVDLAAYLAPEQIESSSVDERSDLYTFGVILFEMLTGKLPFDAATATELLHQHVHQAPVPASHVAPATTICPELDAFLLQLLAKEPSQRYPDARTAALVVATIDNGEPPSDIVVGFPSRETLPWRTAAGGDLGSGSAGASGPASSGAAGGGDDDDDDDDPTAAHSGPFGRAPMIESRAPAPQLPSWSPPPTTSTAQSEIDETWPTATPPSSTTPAPSPTPAVSAPRSPSQADDLAAFGSFTPPTTAEAARPRTDTPVELPTLRVRAEQLTSPQRSPRRAGSKTLIFTPSLPTMGTGADPSGTTDRAPSVDTTSPLHQAPTKPEPAAARTAPSAPGVDRTEVVPSPRTTPRSPLAAEPTLAAPPNVGKTEPTAAYESVAGARLFAKTSAASSTDKTEVISSPRRPGQPTSMGPASVPAGPDRAATSSSSNESNDTPSDASESAAERSVEATEPQPKRKAKSRRARPSDSQDADQEARNRMSAAGSFRVDTMPEDVVRDLVQPLRERPHSGAQPTVDEPIRDELDDDDDDDEWTAIGKSRRPTWAVALAGTLAVAAVAFWWTRGNTPAQDEPAVAQLVPPTGIERQPPSKPGEPAAQPTPPPPTATPEVAPAEEPDFVEATLEPPSGEHDLDDAVPTEAKLERPAPSETRERANSDARSNKKRRVAGAKRAKSKPAADHEPDSSADTEPAAGNRPLKVPGKVVAAVKECGRKHGGLPGDRVSTKLSVDNSGRVSRASTSGRRVSGDLSQCIESALKQAKFAGQHGEHTHYFTL